MLDFINSISFLDENKGDKLYDFYKTFSSHINIEILEKIQQFNFVSDFFDYYTKTDSKFLFTSLNELQNNFSKIINNETSSAYFLSNTDQYISFLSKVTLLLKLILLNKKIINSLLKFTKNYFEKFCNENKIENCHHKEISNLINSLIEQSKIINKSSKNIDDIQSSSNSIKNILQCSLYDKNLINVIKNNNTENEKSDSPNKKYFNGLIDDIPKNLIRRSDGFTISKNNFDNHKKIFNDADIMKNKKREHSNAEYSYNKKNKINDKEKRKLHKHYSESERVVENKELFEHLLEFTNELYHLNIINREEKLKLKKLIISRNKKMEEIYINFTKDENNNKNHYLQEIKKLIS